MADTCETAKTAWVKSRNRRRYWKERRKPSVRRRTMLVALTLQTGRNRRRYERCLKKSLDPKGLGVDFAFDPHPTMGALRSFKIKFVARYLTNRDPRGSGLDKTLSVAEAAELKRSGFPIVLVFESGAARAGEGRAAGVADARMAEKNARILGAPSDTAIYMAVDFDANPEDVRAYFEGARAVLGKRTGAYGGRKVIAFLFDRELIDYGWQTLAWSTVDGRVVWEPRAALQQFRIEASLGGADVDFNRAVKQTYGAW